MREVNFDGLVGPSHNYAGLSLGNIASASNQGGTSKPREAALQGIAKMRRMIGLGLAQGMLLPHDRPNAQWLRQLGFSGSDDAVLAAAWKDEPALLANAMSASSMWTANAATVSPAADTQDGRVHLSVANLSTMLHRSTEAEQTEQQLRLAFSDQRFFAVHAALPAKLGDEGAANFMRLGASHGAKSLEVFVYGQQGSGPFPARQNEAAGRAVARRHQLGAEAQLHIQQADAAIAAGAFHNDVVAVANEHVLFTHEQAFEHREEVYAILAARVPNLNIVEAPASKVSLADAITSYLFNCQLVTLPNGSMTLVVPSESRENASVWAWLQEVVAAQNPLSSIEVIEVRESMRNGGGPACLRLRVALDDDALAAVDPRFMVDAAKCDLLERIVGQYWPEKIDPSDLGVSELWQSCRAARAALLEGLGFNPEEV